MHMCLTLHACMCVSLQAASQQSPMETVVARFAKWYTPTVVLACVLLIIIPAAMRKDDLKVHTPLAPASLLHARLKAC